MRREKDSGSREEKVNIVKIKKKGAEAEREEVQD